MKTLKKALIITASIVALLTLLLYAPVHNALAQKPKEYHGSPRIAPSTLQYDKSKKTVVIVAENAGTEMFDLMAPFYLFNATEKANVIVVSEKKAPILLFNSLFILPHYSLSEIDSVHIHPDVIVIPNLTVHLKTPPNPAVVKWIRSHYSDSTIILAICDGSKAAAATGLYDGKPLTTHATDFNTLRKQYPKPAWVRNVSVTQSGNLYSTAGVSNAVEGSLVVIKRVFGANTMQAVLHKVRYPHADVKLEHQSIALSAGPVVKILSKVLFRRNERIGVMLADSIDEFELASILDTYVRSFPKSINSISITGKSVSSKYGLTLYPTGNLKTDEVTELHILNADSHMANNEAVFAGANIIKYNNDSKLYPIDNCLKRITGLYGASFKDCVKLTLDYN